MAAAAGLFEGLSANAIADFLVAAGVFASSVVAGVLARNAARRYLARVMPSELALVISRLVFYLVAAAGAFAALAALDVDLTSVAILGGVVGVAVGFASQTVVSNLLSGLFLYFDRPLKIGDPVQIEDVAGVVSDINVFSTRIRSWDGVFVRLPNEKVFSSVIRNFSNTVARRVEYRVGVSYRDDADRAREVIMKVLEEHPLVLAEPEPMVFVEELGDSSVNLNVRFWTPIQVWFSVRAELLWKIKKALDEAGIEIPFPQRVVWIRSGDR